MVGLDWGFLGEGRRRPRRKGTAGLQAEETWCGRKRGEELLLYRVAEFPRIYPAPQAALEQRTGWSLGQAPYYDSATAAATATGATILRSHFSPSFSNVPLFRDLHCYALRNFWGEMFLLTFVAFYFCNLGKLRVPSWGCLSSLEVVCQCALSC